MSRTVRIRVVVGLLAVIGVPSLARGQTEFQNRFDHAFTIFNSTRQPEAIPHFSQLIDDLRALRNRTDAHTTVLARALQYRAQARENVGQTTDADADLRLVREVAPSFRLTEPGLSASLVGRFNALVSASEPSPQQSQKEGLLWETIKNSTNPADYQAYLDAYPNGVYAPLAKSRVAAKAASAERLQRGRSDLAKLKGSWAGSSPHLSGLVKDGRETTDGREIASFRATENSAGGVSGYLSIHTQRPNAKGEFTDVCESVYQLEFQASEEKSVAIQVASAKLRCYWYKKNEWATFKEGVGKQLEFREDGSLYLSFFRDPKTLIEVTVAPAPGFRRQ